MSVAETPGREMAGRVPFLFRAFFLKEYHHLRSVSDNGTHFDELILLSLSLPGYAGSSRTGCLGFFYLRTLSPGYCRPHDVNYGDRHIDSTVCLPGLYQPLHGRCIRRRQVHGNPPEATHFRKNASSPGAWRRHARSHSQPTHFPP